MRQAVITQSETITRSKKITQSRKITQPENGTWPARIAQSGRARARRCPKVGAFCLLAMLIAALCCAPAFAANASNQKKATAQAKKKEGLRKEGGHIRFYKKGKLTKNAWVTVGKDRYYFTVNGDAAVGSCKVKGKYYIFSEKGVLYAPAKTKTVKVKGVKYRVNKKGRAVPGWEKRTYYFDKTGRMVTGTVVIDRKLYYFKKGGKCDTAKSGKLQKQQKYEGDATELLKLLGKPKASSYLPGCYRLDGKDGILTYEHFTLLTFREDTGRELYMGVTS